MKLNSKAFKAATAAVISGALVASATPVASASSNIIDSTATTAISIVSSLVGLAISYAFWGTVYNFARSQAWIVNVPAAPGLPNFNRP